MSDKNNEPAFPVSEDTAHFPGMTLRDYFAGQIITGMYSDPTSVGTPEELARYCYQAADAMMKERDNYE